MTDRTNPMTTADAKALVAKAICQAEAKRHYGIDRGADEAWEAATDYARSEWLADAEAALEASPNSMTEAMIEALEFYAEPRSWHGVYMVGSGPMADDWSDDCADNEYPDGKPGKLARDALAMQAARPIEKSMAHWRCVNCKTVTPMELPIAPDRCPACRCSQFAEVAKVGPIAPVQDDDAEWLRDFAAQQPIYRETLERIANHLGNQSVGGEIVGFGADRATREPSPCSTGLGPAGECHG